MPMQQAAPATQQAPAAAANAGTDDTASAIAETDFKNLDFMDIPCRRKMGKDSFQTAGKCGGGRQMSACAVGRRTDGAVFGGLRSPEAGMADTPTGPLTTSGHCAHDPGAPCTQQTCSSTQQPESAAAGAANGDHNNARTVTARNRRRWMDIMVSVADPA
jgi:hypothetical protein